MNNKTLTEIQEMWKKDCQIDDIELDASSLNVPILHAKYSELLSAKKLIQIKYEHALKDLQKGFTPPKKPKSFFQNCQIDQVLLQLNGKPYKTLVKRAISTPGMSFLVPGITKTLIKHVQSVSFCQMAKPFKNLDKMCY